MNSFRALFAGFLGACLLITARGASELRLVARVGDRVLPVVGVENNRIVAEDGTRRVPLRHDAHYELAGDLRNAVGDVFWAPVYGVRATDEALKGLPPGTAAVGHVFLRHMTEMDGRKLPSDFIERWPGGAPDGGIMVLGWMVDGKISQLAVAKVPSTKTARFFVAEHDFPLTREEMRGQGLMLFWAKGQFIAPKPRFKDPRAQQALGAILTGDLEQLRAGLAAGLKTSVKGTEGETLLHFAAEAGADAAVDFLIRQGAAVNAVDQYRSTPLHRAALKGRRDTVERLLAEKAAVNLADGAGNSPLHLALIAGHPVVAEALLARKADASLVNEELQTPCTLAIDGGYASVARLAFAGGARGQSDGEGLQRVLLTQVAKGNVDMVRLLIERKVSVNFEQGGHRPLAEGALSGNADLIPVLLAGGAGINDANADGLTALMFAIGNNRADYARGLVEAGAAVAPRDKTGRSALHYAAAGNAGDLVELLLRKGADPQVRDQGQLSPLDHALLGGAKAAAAALDRAGACVDLKSSQAALLMETAVKLDLAGVVGRALAAGWPADTRFQTWPALLVADTCQAKACAQVLRDAGAQLPAGGPEVVRPKELDQPPRLAAVVLPVDPRDPDTVFPAVLVQIDIVIDPQGQVRFPVVESAPDWLIAQAALRALAGWRFQPLTKQGRPVASRLRLPVEFVASSDLAISYKLADVLPVPLKRVPPAYPFELSKSGQQGVVNLAFTVDVDGHAKDVRIISTSGPAFNQPAMDAVLKWIFKPGELDGEPKPIRLRQEIVFALQ